MKKSLKLAAAGLLAAFALAVAVVGPARASQEGSWLFHAFFLNGPAVFYSSQTSWTDAAGKTWTGVVVTTGTPTTAAATTMNLLGAVTTAARPAGTEGQITYDPTVHSLSFFDGTKWHKLVYTASTGGDAWTSY